MFSQIEVLLGCQEEILEKAEEINNEGLLKKHNKDQIILKMNSIINLSLDLFVTLKEENASLDDNSDPRIKLLKKYLIYYEAIKNESYKFIPELNCCYDECPKSM